MKRTFLQLAHPYKNNKYVIDDWFVSEKLDGMRAFWDGGISRGLLASDIPWANTVKDDRLVYSSVATGLWSRTGKVIVAPDWFLNSLPNLPLDGELWLGFQQFQTLISITKKLEYNHDDWKNVKFCVFDSPSYETIFQDGSIEVRQGNEKYNFHLRNCINWIKENGKGRFRYLNPNASFESVYNYLINNIEENSNLKIINQVRVSNETELNKYYEKILAKGGEGVILRLPRSRWLPGRVHSCLKYKPYDIDEGTVIGYTWGREGKLLGKMGALIVSFNNQTLKVSGFTDEQRIIPNANNEGFQNPGKLIQLGLENPLFPRGSTVKFLYRELTDDGLPKEARYHA